MKFLNNDNILALDCLTEYFKSATKVCVAVAFLRKSGVDLLDHSIREVIKRGGIIQFVAGQDFGYTEPSALEYLSNIGAEIKVYTGNEIFHPKCYLFQNDSFRRVIIGSSNMTSSGLKSGIEWNVALEESDSQIIKLFDSFEQLWNSNCVAVLSEKLLLELKEKENQKAEEQFQKKLVNKMDISDEIIEFDFKTNKTFLDYSSHQLTILTKFNDILLKYIDNNHFNVKLSIENKTINSYIYYGEAGWGPVYIIRTKNDEFYKIADKFVLNQKIKVTIRIRKNSCTVFLEKYN